MDLQRGEVVIVALRGDHGKPRPAVIVQGDLTLRESALIAILPLTSDRAVENLHRVALPPTAANGLRQTSYSMVERLTTVPRARIGPRIGMLEADRLTDIDNSLRLWLGLI